MNATSTAGALAGPAAAQLAPAGSGIARLNPFDGLFLRAEHLERIQAYTRELTSALGLAGGPGVVHGYALSVSGSMLHVGSGLAITRDGRPLSMIAPFSRNLDNLTAAEGQWWVVELVPAEEAFGDESVYGVLCDDPCADEASSRPYIAELVQIRLQEYGLDLGGTALSERRSRVASAWFEDERRRGGSLLSTSDRDPTTAADFSPASWSAPTGPPDDRAVAIGVLLRLAGAWQVDTWTARRDRIETPPERTWRGRLGMRPWAVFIAQVLQFQVQLAETWRIPQVSAALAQLANIPHVVFEVQEAVKGLDHRQLTLPKEHLVSALAMLSGGVVPRSTNGRLVDRGIVELPPAGFLPLSDDEPLEVQVTQMFGPYVELRFCACRPDFIGHAIEQAQHFDRIPLTDPRNIAQVDVLVPGGQRAAGDEDGGITTAHRWVAFHRRRDLDCGDDAPGSTEPVDAVDIFRHQAGPDELEEHIGRIIRGEIQGDQSQKVEATYPADSWALPATKVQQTVQTWTEGVASVTVLGLARNKERRPLADVRAALLISPFDPSSPPVTHRTALMAAQDAQGREQIWVIVPLPVIT